MEPMHEHWTVSDWIYAFEETADEEPLALSVCPRAREAMAAGVGAWLGHVTDCAACREIARAQKLVPDERLHCETCRDALDVVFDLVEEAEHFEPAVVWELQRAEAMRDELRRLPVEDQIARVRADDRFAQWGFAQRLLFDARAAWHDDPHLAHDRALLASVVAERLLPEAYDPRWIADLRAKAHAYLANAHRILARFARAEREFATAEDLLRRGVGAPRAEARVLSLQASLLIDQHRNRQALAVLDRADRLLESVREDHERGRLALKRADILQALGHPLSAAEECARAVTLIDEQVEPRARLIAQQNSVHHLIVARQLDRARALFEHLPPTEDRILAIRRSWIEGDLLRAEGRYGEAREAYERTRTGFADAGMHYDVALVSLDLALAAFEEGHLAEVQHMAREASYYLTLGGAKQEAFTALQLLLIALREEQLTRTILTTVRDRVAALQPS